MSSLTQEKDSKMLADEKPKTLWSEAFKRFKRDKLAIVGAFIILLMLIFAFTAKLIAPYDPTYQFNNGTTAYGMPLPLNSHSKKIVATKKDVNQEFTVKASTVFSDTENKLAYRTVGNTKAKKGMTTIEFMVAPVSIRDVDATPKQEIDMTTKDKVTDYLSNMKLTNDKYFALGTDSDGRDSLSRLIWGAQVSLEVGMLAVGFATVIGVLLGLLSGFFGGWVDMVIMRFTDIMMSMPDLLLVMALVSVLPSQDDKSSQGVGIIIFAIGIVSWTGIARLVRSQVFSIKEMEYVEASKACGAPNSLILFKHLLPNVVAPVIVISTMSIASAIMTEAGLSFLGFGVKPPTPSWGSMVNQGLGFFRDAPWVPIIPGAAIAVAVFAFNLFGDGVRDALDPKLK
jgi:peptide/nickel transport system permease protein